MGGMFGESKFDVLTLVPEQYKPKTILIKYPVSFHELVQKLKETDLKFPLVFKPDLGERGFMVKRIFNESDVETYLEKIRADFLIQELIDWPVECGVFYTRFPDKPKGEVTSVVIKEMLSVTGNGLSTLQELILSTPRAKLQWEVLKEVYASRLNEIVATGERIELISIGNHCLGTKFLNGEQYINKRLSDTFDHISKQIPEFYFGRYDLRCQSMEDLYEGKIMVMELNGCGAEPAHIYQPGYSLWKALGVMATHWKNLYRISMQNHKRGVKFVSFVEGKRIYKHFKATVG